MNEDMLYTIAGVIEEKPGSAELKNYDKQAYPDFEYIVPDGDVFLALLGSSNGMGTAYLLAGRKD